MVVGVVKLCKIVKVEKGCYMCRDEMTSSFAGTFLNGFWQTNNIMGFTSHQGPLVSRAGVAVSSYIFGVAIVLGPLAAASLAGGPCRVVSPVADLKRFLLKKNVQNSCKSLKNQLI